MLSRPSTAFTALLGLALGLTSARVRAFYTPNTYDVTDVSEYPVDSVSSNSSTSTACETPGAFALQNRTDPLGFRADSEPKSGSDSGSEGTVQKRDVWRPKIWAPTASTVWTIGEIVQVKWDNNHPPSHVTNYEGQVILGYLEYGDEANEHLDFDHPLASGFNLTQGHISVQVPDVPPSNDYIIVLFGDSGNRSPRFTITD